MGARNACGGRPLISPDRAENPVTKNERPGADPGLSFSSLRGAKRRSNPAFLLRAKLDCFASLAMTGLLLRRFRRRQRRIVRISLGAAAVERVLVPRVQRRALLEALDEVGVGDEGFSKRDQIGRVGVELPVGELEVVTIVGDIGLLEP